MRRLPTILAVLLLVLGLAALPHRLVSRPALNPDFTHFESSHVHPVAITPDGRRLLVVNTSDARLSVFDLTGAFPVRIAEIPVGLEPVSVAARDDGEAWVVNHLSDDVSIVDLATLHVRATLRVGDEPCDVVFAGSSSLAYVSVSQEDAVKVFDPTALGSAPTVIAIPGRRPRALARSADGARVLVDIFNSSASATILSPEAVGDSMPAPDPPLRAGLPPPPRAGLVVQRNAAGNWVDPSGKIWNSKIAYDVPAVELVTLSTATRQVESVRGGMTTIAMGLAIDPVTGAAAVSGMRAVLDRRFEPNVRGRFTAQTLAIVPGSAGAHRDVELDPHIDYSITPGPRSDADSALGMPTGVCWSPDGRRVYVTSLVSDKLGVLDASGSMLARVATVVGPTGVIADPVRGRLYVVGRFRNQLQTLSAASLASLAIASIGFDPTPDAIVLGRKFFYGGFTSGHGDQACASCHLFGDLDGLAWDLGDPRGEVAPPPPGMDNPSLQGFHPMKGPMVTQSLRGLVNVGVLHWRGDRADLGAFNPAFVSLMGRSSMLPDAEMAALSDFVLPLVYPPNPNQNLDRSFPDAPTGQPSARRGRDFFTNVNVDRPRQCEDCHRLPSGTDGSVIDHLALIEPQDFKVPQLRNEYAKSGFKNEPGAVSKRGFGYTHDGSKDDVFRFLHFPGFIFGTTPELADANRRDVEAFVLAFDTGMAPAVGRQITFDGTAPDASRSSTLDTLRSQAETANCDLIAKGRVGGMPRGWMYLGGDQWRPDAASESDLATAALIALASAGHELTVTGVPLGTAERAGLDRDRDGHRDADELAAGSDPGDPASIPGDRPPVAVESRLGASEPNPFREGMEVVFDLARSGAVEVEIFDVLGRRARRLTHESFAPGRHRLHWDGRRDDGSQAGNGVYFVRMNAEARHWTRAVVRLR